SELLGPPGAGGSVWASLPPCVTQLILSNTFLGAALGAFREAREYTVAFPKSFQGSSAERLADDPYVLEHYGEMHVMLKGAELLLEAAAEALQHAWEREDSLTAEERGACAAAVSIAKVAAGRCALDVTKDRKS